MTTQGASAGWYPDPWVPEGKRWWDGSNWTSHVQPPSPPPRNPPVPPRQQHERSTSRGMGRGCLGRILWGAVGAFAVAIAGLVIAVMRDQDVKSINPKTGVVEFYSTGAAGGASDSSTVSKIEASQSELSSRLDALEQQAGAGTGTTTGEPGAIGDDNFTGRWRGSNGAIYSFQQVDGEVICQEISPISDDLVTAVGSGTVSGSTAVIEYEAFDGSLGVATLTVQGDGSISGTFTNETYGISTPAQMQRIS